LVQTNQKLHPIVANSQSLWDATFTIKLGELMKLAEKLGVLESLIEAKTFKLTAGYFVMSMTTDEFITALKYFAVLSYYLEKGEAPNIPIKTILEWQQAAVNVFAQFKVNLRVPIAKITKVISHPNVKLTDKKGDPLPSYEIIYDQTKIIRDALYAKRAKILADPGATSDLRRFLANIFTYFNNRAESKSEKSFDRLAQNVRVLKDPKLSGIMHPSANVNIDNTPIAKYQRWIAKKTDRKNPQYLIKEEVEALSPKDAEIHNKLRLDHNKAYKAKLQDVIRSSQQPHLPALQVKKQLEEKGFPSWSIPKGFTGNVGERGELYTHTGMPLDKGQAGGVMEMNPNWHKNQSEFYARGRSNFATTPAWQYFQTMDHVKNKRNDDKQRAANELEEKLPMLQQKWRKDLRSKDEGSQLFGAIMEALYQTQARIGGNSTGNAATGKEKAYGVTTWLNKHIKSNAAGSLIITYPAKSGMVQRHVIKPDTPEKTAFIQYVLKLKDGKGPNDPIWVTKNGLTVGSGRIRAYMKYLGLEDAHPHSFRHAAGNAAWQKAITEKPLKAKNPTPKQVMDYYKDITQKVGQILGHQRTKKDGTTENVGGTAAKSYVDPQLQVQFFRDKGVPVPPALEKIAKDEE
jgi:DNA topoisomerase IB